MFRRNTDFLKRNVSSAIELIRMLTDQLCGTVFAQNVQPTVPLLTVDDSNSLIDGMKHLFDCSDYDEQVRLLTLSPPGWGRVKIENFFGCNEWQARKALEIRDSFGMLAKPTNFSGNHPVDPLVIDEVELFYQDDTISRQSSNKKEVLHVKGQIIPIRYMSMTVGQAYILFLKKIQDIDPLNFISKTVFYSLRPKWVKILKPHDTCACIYHENFDFLIQVRNFYFRRIEKNFYVDRVGISWV